MQKIDPVNEKEINSLKGEWLKRHEEVVAAGGLHIIGTERHESRRVDNQLRGRSGRQGDPGSSRFYLSLEDNLMRIFASDRITAIMQKLGMESSEAIESGIVSRAIENAQRKVEAHNFDIRKHLLEFDDVANDQRKVIYEQRNELLEEQDISDNIESMREDVIIDTVNSFIPPGSIDELWDIHGLEEVLERDFDISENIQGWLENDDNLNQESLRQRIMEIAIGNAKQKEEKIGSDIMRRLEKQVMLDFLDRHWKDHLISMDHLRQGIGLRSYAAKNPKQEYKKESFELFVSMLENLKFDVIRFLSKVQVRTEEDVEKAEQQHKRSESMNFSHPEAKSALAAGSENPNKAAKTPFVREGRKIGRNEPCPCGSGKKYKQCHGRLN